ncbi:MAG TPA: sigma-70 family RNA polymerase sigma factor [Chitinophagaceae bacterium]|nr:sigma-70 family RNA polymerase sigma factor [Chitinophagaceae bacterium]
MQTNWHIIIEACKKQEPAAQEQLYRRCYPAMIRICMRYCNGQADMAGGVYNHAMLKVFNNIGQYTGKGEFEGWVRRIIVNTCIDHGRSNAKFQSDELKEETAEWLPIIPDAYSRISGNEILNLVYTLPRNTGLVFNLFVMEGYKHEEIGKILGISSGTSKWHLNEARKLLKQKLETLFKKESLANAI